MARRRRSASMRNRRFQFEQLEPKLALASVAAGQTEVTAPTPLLPKIQVSHFGQDIPFVGGTIAGVTMTARQMFQSWSNDYISFITNSGAKVASINIGDYLSDTKGYYAYLDPKLGDVVGGTSVPWIVTDFLDRLPAGVEVGAIAYLDVANPWLLYPNGQNDGQIGKSQNFPGNNLTTDGKAGSPPKNNLYQAFQLINEINAAQLAKGGTKLITHFEADGEGAGAFETDTYYGFGGPGSGSYNPQQPNQLAPGSGWTWTPSAGGGGTASGWPVAGYGAIKWLWNHFMPGVTAEAAALADGSQPLAVGAASNVVFTDAQAVTAGTWSAATGSRMPYQFGIIKYAQTAWLAYSPGPMVAFTENYWFGENHYLPGPGSSILANPVNINGVQQFVLPAPPQTHTFPSTPKITFNTPIDAAKNPIGTPAEAIAIMGAGAIDATVDPHPFFGGNGVGAGYSPGAWVTAPGSGYQAGDKYTLNAVFSPPPAGPGNRPATGFVQVDANGGVQAVVVLDPGQGYTEEPTISFTGPGTGAAAVALVTAANGYPQIDIPSPPTPTDPLAPQPTRPVVYLTVNPQGRNQGQIAGITFVKDALGNYQAGSGYDYNPISGNSSTQPGGQFAGPGGLKATFSTTPAPAAYRGGTAFAAAPPIYLPVNSGPDRIEQVLVTVLGDHYAYDPTKPKTDPANRNWPVYTIGDDPTPYYVDVNPAYSGAYVPPFNLAGSFPVDATGRSSVTILDGGSGYSAGVLITDGGAGYDNKQTYSVTFSGGGSPSRQATGILSINSNGQAAGVVITDPGEGYTSEPSMVIQAPGITGGRVASGTVHLINYPRVTITGGTFVSTGGTAAVPFAITSPIDPNHPGDPDTGYIVTAIGFTNPGLGYDPTKAVPTFTIEGGQAHNRPAQARALPALANVYTASELKTISQILGTLPADWNGQIQGGANAYNLQTPNGYGPGQVTGVTFTSAGSGYTSPPVVTFGDPPTGGRRATGTAVLGTGNASHEVVSITITDPGFGYVNPPSLSFSGGGGTTQAVATGVLGQIQVPSPRALDTVYAYYRDHPAALAAIFNDPNYQDVSLPKLSEQFYWPLDWASFGTAGSTDGTQTPQQAIATFSIESINRSNTFVDGVYQPNGPLTRTSLDSRYQPDNALATYNSYGGTFAGLSSLSYANFVAFLNAAAVIVADAATKGGSPMLPQDVTFQIYDAAFLPVEWLTQANPNRWSAVNEAPVFVSQAGGSVVENTPHATPIYAAHASDVGTTWAERTVTYSLKPGVGDEADLTIDPRSGEVRLLRPANYEAKRSYTFVVVASDGGSPVLTSERAVTVTVDDVPEDPTAPAIAAPARFTVLEHGATRLTFSTTPFSDADSAAHKPMTVTLGVPVGRIVAASGAGVTVGGSAKRRTLSGRLDAINAYLAAGRVSYVPEAGAVAARTLSIVISESYGSFSRRATAESALDVLPVDDAPRVQSPARFRVLEDAPGNLVWPAGITPFSDDDSAVLTVTLSVDRGVIASTGDEGVTVGGSDTARTFRGAPADLNRLFQRPGGIIYTPATDDTAAVTLTTTVADGMSQAVASSRIMVVPLNDAPTQRASGLVLGATAGRPVRIDPDQLATATVARDVDSRRVSFLLTGTTSGQVERLVGGRWVPMRTTGPVATRLIDGRDPVRWVAPAGALGTTPAFTVQAWDGRLASTTISQISVSIAATDDTAFAYFIDDTTQVSNVPAGYGVIGEFSETERAAAVASGRIVGESVAMFNQQSDNTVGYSLWPLIENLFQSRTPVAPGDRQALARQILDQVLVNKGLTATSEFPSPDEGVPAGPGAGYVIWAQDFEFRPGIVPTTDVYAGVTAVLWAGRTYLGDSFKIMPVPSSSLFKTLGDTTVNGKGAYVSDEIINGTASTPYLASLGLEGLPENPQHGSNGEWNFLSLLYANGLIDGFFGQNYNTTQVGIVTPDTLPFHDPSLPYAIQSAHDNPTQVASGGPWSTVYNGDVPFHATVYWLANVDPTWGQPPKKPVLQPTQAPLPTTAFAAYGRSN